MRRARPARRKTACVIGRTPHASRVNPPNAPNNPPPARRPRAPGAWMTPARRTEMFRRLQAVNPPPETELVYSTPFELLVAVILSAQATDKSVNKATEILYPKANTPQAILKLGEAGLSRYIKTIGLYNAKAKNIIATCRILLERHGGQVPRDREALEELPGVGRK